MIEVKRDQTSATDGTFRKAVFQPAGFCRAGGGALYEREKFFMIHGPKGNHNTLPTLSTSRNASSSRVSDVPVPRFKPMGPRTDAFCEFE
jgi:hypothetical protein